MNISLKFLKMSISFSVSLYLCTEKLECAGTIISANRKEKIQVEFELRSVSLIFAKKKTKNTWDSYKSITYACICSIELLSSFTFKLSSF